MSAHLDRLQPDWKSFKFMARHMQTKSMSFKYKSFTKSFEIRAKMNISCLHKDLLDRRRPEFNLNVRSASEKNFARLKIWKSSIPSWNSDRYMSSNWLRWESSYNRAAFCASEFLLILFSIRKQTWTDWRVNMNLVVTVEFVCSSEFRSVSFGYRRPYVLTGLSTYFGLQTQFYVCHFL